ncbi:MAG: hypothetical protein U5L02_08035 [Rheinheimera sp.]|nr:hypothetical protein [Rheinheimera sp.]
MLPIVLILIAVSAALIAVSVQAGQYGTFSAIVAYYAPVSPGLLAQVAQPQIWGLSALVVLALLSLRWRLAQQLLALSLILFSALPLISLFGAQHYIARLWAASRCWAQARA